MSDRKLFYAKDAIGNRILIDKLLDREQKLFCPHCNEEVIPKMGQKNVWHFSHIGKECKFLSKNSTKTENKKFGDYNFSEVENIDVTESNKYCCKICNGTRSKESGRRIKDSIWVCKTCYVNASHSVIDELLE